MGIWWENFTAPDNVQGISFAGDPNALLKDWTQRWRWQHKWRILKVPEGVNIYSISFSSNGIAMRYKKPIVTQYVGVRIGRDDVKFFAIGLFRGEVRLTDTGFYGRRGDALRSPGAHGSKEPNMSSLYLAGKITWI